MKTIIGLIGVKQSGKDTSAQFIQEILSDKDIKNIKKMALADKLKDVCSDAFGITREAFDDQRYKEIPFKVFGIKKELTPNVLYNILKAYGFCFYKYVGELEKRQLINMELNSPRHIAQIVGTQVLRMVGSEDIHCEQLILDTDYNIITDVRFENEYNFFNNKQDYKFMPLYINRNCAEEKITEKTHESEKEVFKFRNNCIHINNNGSLDDLKNNLKHIITLKLYCDRY